MVGPVISVKDLSVSFHPDGEIRPALSNVSFDVYPGEILGIVGESGSGKSTLARAMQGLLDDRRHTSVTGSVVVQGNELRRLSASRLRELRRAVIRSIPQDPLMSLNPALTIRKHMKESGVADWNAATEHLERLGLEGNKILSAVPHRLSGGQRQRVLIAMALAARPRILVADEPTTALDEDNRVIVLNELRRRALEEDLSVVLITHDLSIAAAYTDRIMVLNSGQIVETGPAINVIKHPEHPYTCGLMSSAYDLTTDRSKPIPTFPVENSENFAGCASVGYCASASDRCSTERPSPVPGRRKGSFLTCHYPEARPSLQTLATWTSSWPPSRSARTGSVLSLCGVSVSYPTSNGKWFRNAPPTEVIKRVSFDVTAGEAVAIIGKSGAGKSTLLRVAAGQIKPDSGKVRHSAEGSPQMIFQDAGASLTPWLSIRGHIEERLGNAGYSGNELARRLRETLDLVELDIGFVDALPIELSAGQCQRAAIARAIALPPTVILCDEPTSSLDASLAANTLNLLGSLRREIGAALVFVTHDLAAARLVADRVGILEDGVIKQWLEPDAMAVSREGEIPSALQVEAT